MTDESNPKAQPINPATSGVPSKSTPASGARIGDPARRSFGDRTDSEPQRPGDSKGSRFDEETNSDAGEGHKGPYAATNSDSDASRPRSESSNSATTPSQQPKGGAHDSGRDSGKGSEVKPARSEGGGSTKM